MLGSRSLSFSGWRWQNSDFKSRYNAFKGNAYGLANTLKQTANLKPSLKANKMVEKKNKPEVRFKGFDDEWEDRELKDRMHHVASSLHVTLPARRSGS